MASTVGERFMDSDIPLWMIEEYTRVLILHRGADGALQLKVEGFANTHIYSSDLDDQVCLVANKLGQSSVGGRINVKVSEDLMLAFHNFDSYPNFSRSAYAYGPQVNAVLRHISFQTRVQVTHDNGLWEIRYQGVHLTNCGKNIAESVDQDVKNYNAELDPKVLAQPDHEEPEFPVGAVLNYDTGEFIYATSEADDAPPPTPVVETRKKLLTTSILEFQEGDTVASHFVRCRDQARNSLVQEHLPTKLREIERRSSLFEKSKQVAKSVATQMAAMLAEETRTSTASVTGQGVSPTADMERSEVTALTFEESASSPLLASSLFQQHSLHEWSGMANNAASATSGPLSSPPLPSQTISDHAHASIFTPPTMFQPQGVKRKAMEDLDAEVQVDSPETSPRSMQARNTTSNDLPGVARATHSHNQVPISTAVETTSASPFRPEPSPFSTISSAAAATGSTTSNSLRTTISPASSFPTADFSGPLSQQMQPGPPQMQPHRRLQELSADDPTQVARVYVRAMPRPFNHEVHNMFLDGDPSRVSSAQLALWFQLHGVNTNGWSSQKIWSEVSIFVSHNPVFQDKFYGQLVGYSPHAINQGLSVPRGAVNIPSAASVSSHLSQGQFPHQQGQQPSSLFRHGSTQQWPVSGNGVNTNPAITQGPAKMSKKRGVLPTPSLEVLASRRIEDGSHNYWRVYQLDDFLQTICGQKLRSGSKKEDFVDAVEADPIVQAEVNRLLAQRQPRIVQQNEQSAQTQFQLHFQQPAQQQAGYAHQAAQSHNYSGPQQHVQQVVQQQFPQHRQVAHTPQAMQQQTSIPLQQATQNSALQPNQQHYQSQRHDQQLMQQQAPHHQQVVNEHQRGHNHTSTPPRPRMQQPMNQYSQQPQVVYGQEGVYSQNFAPQPMQQQYPQQSPVPWGQHGAHDHTFTHAYQSSDLSSDPAPSSMRNDSLWNHAAPPWQPRSVFDAPMSQLAGVHQQSFYPQASRIPHDLASSQQLHGMAFSDQNEVVMNQAQHPGSGILHAHQNSQPSPFNYGGHGGSQGAQMPHSSAPHFTDYEINRPAPSDQFNQAYQSSMPPNGE